MIQFLFPKQRNKTFYFAAVKNNFNIYESCLVFGENSFIPATFSIKLINFYETDPPVSAVKRKSSRL